MRYYIDRFYYNTYFHGLQENVFPYANLGKDMLRLGGILLNFPADIRHIDP